MDWSTYKEICERPDVFSRWALDLTASHLTCSLAEKLSHGISKSSIPKPQDHKGDRRTDMFRLNLPQEVQQAILTHLTKLSHDESQKPDTNRKLTNLVSSWRELVELTLVR